jgi:spore maturation protein B
MNWTLLILPIIFVVFPLYGLYKKVPVYEVFVEGAKEGFGIGVRIIPYLVAILCAIAMFRASGAMEMITSLLNPLFEPLGISSDITTMAFIRPLTGSGSVGILADLIQTYGEDALIVKMAGIMFGSTETTFYVLAVYFGAVGVRKTRWAIKAGLLADAAGAIAAILIGYWFFG